MTVYIVAALSFVAKKGLDLPAPAGLFWSLDKGLFEGDTLPLGMGWNIKVLGLKLSLNC